MLVQFAVPLAVYAVALAQATPAAAPPAPPTPIPVVTPVPAASPLPAPSATPAPIPAPTGPATASPATPSPLPSPAASASPYLFVVSPTAPPAANAPRIVQIALNDRVLHPGGALRARVTTTVDVSGVVCRLMGHEIALQKQADGVFGIESQIPGAIPFWLLGRDYSVDVVASRPDGQSASSQVTLRLAR